MTLLDRVRFLPPPFALAGLLLLAVGLAGCPASPPAPSQEAGGSTTDAAPAESVSPSASPGADSPPPGEAAPPAPQTPSPPPATPPVNAGAPVPGSPAAAPAPDAAAVALPELPDPYTVPFVHPLDKARAAEGWISLFDGHSLMGWRRHADGANWSVQDGAITADAGPIDLLCTAIPFADFELEIDFRMEPGGNSGVFLRTDDRPGQAESDCFELNIADTHPQGFTTGAFVGRKATAAPILGSGGWKTFRVVAEGTHFTVHLDGERVLDYTDESAVPRLSGLIGLQKNAGKIEFRNIFLRPLGLRPLFNGQDLSGWRVAPGGASEFTVADGAIQVKNGRGFLETEGAWADFLFQGEARTNAPELNSGFFFRAPAIEPGGNCNGYEAQIHNALIDGDRLKPKDFGTGAIYRRVKARYVVPNDGEWFTTTIAAFGPRIAVWVDGYQVVDWEDDRPPADSPRNGLFTAAGHIALQGHDPTTDLSFRNLRLVELKAR